MSRLICTGAVHVLLQEVVVGGASGVTLGEEASAALYIQNDGALDVEYDIEDSSAVSSTVSFCSGSPCPSPLH